MSLKTTDKHIRNKKCTGTLLTDGAGQQETIVMLPYTAHDHSNRHKVHVQEVNNEVGALCGFYHHYYASALPFMGGGVVDKEWLQQADPDHVICLNCKRIALKKLAT